jgi:hypothetical protein
MLPEMSPAASPAGKQTKHVRVGLPADVARDFEELRWALRAESEGALGLRLIREAIAAHAHLLSTPPVQPPDTPAGGAPPQRRTPAPVRKG